MKLHAIFALLFAGALSAQDVTFGSAPHPGVWSDTAAFESSISVAGGKTPATATRSIQRSKSSCVAATGAGGRIAALEVSYASASDGEVVGKTYRVTPAAVTYADGTLPPPAEIAFVRRDNRGFGHFRALERILAGASMAIGSSIEARPADAAELMNVAPDMRVRTLTLTLRSVENGVARFDVAMTAAGETLTLAVTGTLDVVAATSRPRRMELSGDIEAARFAGKASMNVAYAF